MTYLWYTIRSRFEVSNVIKFLMLLRRSKFRGAFNLSNILTSVYVLTIIINKCMSLSFIYFVNTYNFCYSIFISWLYEYMIIIINVTIDNKLFNRLYLISKCTIFIIITLSSLSSYINFNILFCYNENCALHYITKQINLVHMIF